MNSCTEGLKLNKITLQPPKEMKWESEDNNRTKCTSMTSEPLAFGLSKSY